LDSAQDTPSIVQIEQRLGEKMAIALATAFLDDTKGMLETIKSCVEKQDAAKLHQLTHKLLGVSASIMDKETHQLCRCLEDKGDDHSWKDAANAYEKLHGSLTRTREGLKQYLKNKRPA
jgi:HPt (histidine-containing phosphotransfer) domain-containing protein